VNETVDLAKVFGLGSQFSYWFLVFWISQPKSGVPGGHNLTMLFFCF